MRDAGNGEGKYDIDRMLAQADGKFTLFGGEPLLVPLSDLERLLKFGYEKYGENCIQTNGALITQRHIELFRLYNVHVGISFDGPGELNDARRIGSIEATRQASKRTEEAIEKLVGSGIVPSLIITLSRVNASAGPREKLKGYLSRVAGFGLRHVRLHLLELERSNTDSIALSKIETVEAITDLIDYGRMVGLSLDLFEEMVSVLENNFEHVSCIWRGCDPYTTSAVQGINGDGARVNCGRTNKDGIDFIKAEVPGKERQLALYHTPQEFGGCKDCRFFLACKGECPGTGVGGDWRNKTEHCEVLKVLFEARESELTLRGITPISLSERRLHLEREWLNLPQEIHNTHNDHWDFGGRVPVK